MAHNLFLDNAYSILGLESDASEKDVMRRGRELDKILEIGEVPEYECDFSFSKERRTKKNVEVAERRLLDSKNDIIDTFFWFNPHNSIDRAAIQKCKNNAWIEAIEMWSEQIKGKADKTGFFLEIRNRAVAESILFAFNHSNKWLKASARDWIHLFESEDQWRSFSRIYKMENPSIDDRIVEGFRDRAKDLLTDFYFYEIKEIEDNDSLLETLGSVFGTLGKAYEDETIKPLVDRIRGLIQKADDWKSRLNKNEYFGDGSKFNIVKLRKEIDSSVGELQGLGDKIWNRSDIKKLRNDCANSINYLCNQLLEEDAVKNNASRVLTVMEFLKLAYNIAPENSEIERQIKKNLEVIDNNLFFIVHKGELELIGRYIDQGNLSGATEIINRLLKNPDIDERTTAQLNELKAKIRIKQSQQTTSSIISILFWLLGAPILFSVFGYIISACNGDGGC